MSKGLKLFSLVMVLAFALSIAGCQKTPAAPSSSKPVTIHIITMDQAAMSTAEMDAIAREFEAKNPGILVNMEYVGYDYLHDKIVTGLSANPPAYDAVMVDVVWPDEYIKAGYLEDVTSRITPEMKDGIFPAAFNGITRNGKIYGMPWLMDTKYFYYNTDILSKAGFTNPPATWEELISMAKTIKEKGLAEFPIVWSWAQKEAVICDFTALLYGNGGTFLDSAGKPAFNNDKGVQVLTWMKQTLDDGLTNPASTTYVENDVYTNFLAGKAAFALNWQFMYIDGQFDSSKSQVTGKVALAPIPVYEAGAAAGIKGSSVDGSSAFALVAASPNKDATWKFLTYLSSEEVQMKYSAKQLPIWKAAYEGKALEDLKAATQAGPFTVPAFLAQFPYANERPTVPYYNEASVALQLAIQEALTGTKSPKDALDAAAAKWVELAGK